MQHGSAPAVLRALRAESAEEAAAAAAGAVDEDIVFHEWSSGLAAYAEMSTWWAPSVVPSAEAGAKLIVGSCNGSKGAAVFDFSQFGHDPAIVRALPPSFADEGGDMALCPTPDGTAVFVSDAMCMGTEVRAISLVTGEQVFGACMLNYHSLCVSHDQRLAFARSEYRSCARVCSLPDGETLANSDHDSEVIGACFGPRGDELLVWEISGRLAVLDALTLELKRELFQDGVPDDVRVGNGAVCAARGLVATALSCCSTSLAAVVWDASWTPRFFLCGAGAVPVDVAFDSSGFRGAVLFRGGVVALYTLTGAVGARLRPDRVFRVPNAQRVARVEFSDDLVIVSCEDSKVFFVRAFHSPQRSEAAAAALQDMWAHLPDTDAQALVASYL